MRDYLLRERCRMLGAACLVASRWLPHLFSHPPANYLPCLSYASARWQMLMLLANGRRFSPSRPLHWPDRRRDMTVSRRRLATRPWTFSCRAGFCPKWKSESLARAEEGSAPERIRAYGAPALPPP